MSKEKEIAEEYASSLADLTVNSKPLINMLTILAEENVEHAGVIVDTVEKHLEKVQPDIKLPVLYLVDSIIKNVGGAYAQKFAQSIVNMFTRTFKQVDEKVRSQMFKLRETWHDVFPATKLYQLDVKVNLMDPAWPIQAQPQPHQANIHNVPTTSSTPTLTPEEEKMRSILAKKEQELLMLQQKKIEMQLEQTRRQLELAEKSAKKMATVSPSAAVPASGAASVMPAAQPSPVAVPSAADVTQLPVKARLGPPVHKPSSGGRIAPVSAALIAARRDPRLARQQASAPAPGPAPPPPVITPLVPQVPVIPHMRPVTPAAPPIAPNVFDIKPLDRATKRKNVITYEVQPDDVRTEPRARRDPRLAKRTERMQDRRREKIRLKDERRKLEEERDRRGERLERKDTDKPEHKPEHKPDENHKDTKKSEDKDKNSVDKYIDKIPDPKRINKLPPIPKLNREEHKDKDAPSPVKRKKDLKTKKTKDQGKDSSSGSSPEKKPSKLKEKGARASRGEERRAQEKNTEPELVAFKELKNYHKERYMRRNKEKSESPPPVAMEEDAPEKLSSNASAVESKDVDLRVLPGVQPEPAAIGGKRPSTETAEGKPKKNKLDKFDILFGNEDVDLRQLPQVEEAAPAHAPLFSSPATSPATASPKSDPKGDADRARDSPKRSPKKDWHEVKEKESSEVRKTPSKLDLVRAKLAEATRGKDRLGRPLLFSKSPSVEKERRRTISSSEDTDLRTDNSEEFDAEDHKKTISIIMNQAKEQYTDGQLDKNQYNTLMYQVLQLNEKLKLKEAKQRESLELSKQKLKAARIQNQNNKIASPKSSPNTKNNYGDIDERITPAPFMDAPQDNKSYLQQDSDMRMLDRDSIDGKRAGLLPAPPVMPAMFMPYAPSWRGPRPRPDEYVPRRYLPPMQPPFFRPKFEKRVRVPFERMPLPLPTPKVGMYQGDSPLVPYKPIEPPPPLGAPGVTIPPTDYKIIEYIDQDPVKTIQIDGIPREIRYYGDTAIIMLDWDDPREIKFLPGCRRVTFDNKDSVVISFNEPYKQVEIDDQVFDIRFGAPTRELFINGRWWESFFGGQPLGVIIDGKPRLVHLEGPLPQVDIGKTKRTDLVAGKVNLIVNATQMCPVYLDAKVQKFMVNGQYYTIRFVDALKTVLINEQPFKVEFGDLPKPITLGNEKFFIRFSALPRYVKPGFVQIEGMEGAVLPALMPPVFPLGPLALPSATPMEVDQDLPRPPKTPSPEQEHKGLDMLASVMPSNMEEAPTSATEYSSAEPLFLKPDKIPGLETPQDEKPPSIPVLGNINVNDLFAKLLATGIVQMPQENKKEAEGGEQKEEVKQKPKDNKTKLHRVDLLRPETLRVKQPAIVAKLYGGMQCSGCGARFPPEHTVRYSQHLDWHFRQNRRERDSARRAHSRHWHYDLSDWVQYEEVEDLEEREKSWFETGGAEGESEGLPEPETEAPSVAAGAPQDHHCELCGDKFDQFYNEDKEEWHLRNSVRHEDKNYHPMCFEDYKASLTKEEPPKEEAVEVISVEAGEAEAGAEGGEPIAVDGDDTNSQSDADDVVEVVEEKGEPEPPLEIDEGEEDDVVLKAEPIEEVVVNDDADTDDETEAERKERDRQAEIDFSKVKVKQEPVDPDDEPIITAEDSVQTTVDTTHTTVQSSIDGNVQLSMPPVAPVVSTGIRINISKNMPPLNTFLSNNICVLDDRTSLQEESSSVDDEPLPPGEEPQLEYTLKPELEGVSFSRQPPVMKGSELSGLCSIM